MIVCSVANLIPLIRPPATPVVNMTVERYTNNVCSKQVNVADVEDFETE